MSEIYAVPREQHDHTASLPADGSIGIREGSLHVYDPHEDGACAVLIPLPPMRWWVNGVELQAASPVSSSDRIEWERAAQPLYEIQVSPDRMKASICVFAEAEYGWKLADALPSSSMAPKAIPNPDKIIRKLEIAEIMSEIGRLGIRKNLDVSAVVQALQEAQGTFVPFAFGEAPIPGEDAVLELFFEEKIENAFEEVGGALDYRNHLRIPSVQAGEPLARLQRSSPGSPGFDVYGEVIQPPPVREIEVRARQHVEMREEGLFVATKAGRPCVTGDSLCDLDVSDAYVVAGDVDLKTGHIIFSGDVTIQGNVTDNMIVESLGNVYISGGVYHSMITAAGSIIVQGSVISSRLYSGSFGISFNRLFHLSGQLKDEIAMLFQAARLLQAETVRRGQTARFGQVVLLLLKTKFKNIQNNIRELLQVLVTVQRSTGSDSNEFADLLNLMLSPAQMIEFLDEQQLLKLQANLGREHSFVHDMQQDDSHIELSRCQTSTVKSNGDILIHREGVLQSDLYASGSITFKHPSSVCRGSCLEAEEAILARTVGSAGGAPCILRAKNKIHVYRMFEGKISVGGLNRDIFSPVHDYTFGCGEAAAAAVASG
ncbi:hypothetical protein B9G55_22465 [Saccharibacillus sp. O16]|nr:hypothetical protein B9G55_22465 [Saccharibacillus sp. O16]